MNIKYIYKKVLIPLTIAALVAGLSSCTKDSGKGGSAASDKEVEMLLFTDGSNSLTRATVAGSPAENMVNSLTLLVFDGSGDNAKYLYQRNAWRKVAGKNAFKTTLKIGDNLTIYFAANAGKVLSTLTESDLKEGVTTWEELKAKLIMSTLPKDMDIANDGLPMWGIANNKSISEDTNNLGAVQLMRSVASANVKVSDTDFILEAGYVVYAADKGYLHYDPANKIDYEGSIQVSKPVSPAGMKTEAQIQHTVAEGGREIKNVFYMYENDAPIENTSASTKKQTKIILQGKWSGSGKTSFYPLAFRENDTDPSKPDKRIQVKRNCQYNINITKVNGDGYGSITDAMEGEDVNFDYEISEWQYKSDDYIIIDGSKYISLEFPKQGYTVTGDERTIELPHNAGSYAVVFMHTNYSADSFLMYFDADSPEQGSLQNDRFKVELISSPTESHFKFTALQDYSVSGGNEQTVTIQVGRKKIVFNLVQTNPDYNWEDGGDIEL